MEKDLGRARAASQSVFQLFSFCSMPQHIPRGGNCDGSNASGGVAPAVFSFFVWVIRKNDRKCRTFVSYHLVPPLDSSISENFPFNWPS